MTRSTLRTSLALLTLGGCCTDVDIVCAGGFALDVITPQSVVGSDVDIAVSMGSWPFLCGGVLSLDEPIHCAAGELVATEEGFRFDLQGSVADERVFVTVRIDGVDVVESEVAGTFGEPFAPNGKMCGPICVSGEGTLVIDQLPEGS